MRLSGAAAALGRAIRGAVPLTGRGAALAGVAIAALAAGILRSDLAALFWSASFLLFALFAVLTGHLFRAVLRRRGARTPPLLSVTLPSAGVPAGERAEAHVSADLPGRFPPGFSARMTLPLAWHERRISTVSLKLSPGKSHVVLPFTAAPRGTYASGAAVLEVRDILGFTRHRLPVPLRETLTVTPALHPVGEITPFMEQADEAAADTRRRRRSEELLEARKYYPGDDLRRLNWKVFAHLNELFLRIGEEVPPPESRILVVLDCTANPLLPGAVAADYLDGLVSSCASLVWVLIERRMEVMLSLPGTAECRSYGEESRPAMLAVLADAWWTDAPWAPVLPGRKSLHVAVFSSPGSPGLRQILSQVQRHGWSASLFIKAPEPEAPRGRPPLRELFFLPREGARRAVPSPLGARQREAIEDALSRDLAAFGAPAGLVKHAAAI
jgi:uncharacterized protein (DUF58 family)